MTGFLYAIGGDNGQIKVGWSADPFRRLSKIRSDCPEHVSLLGVIPASRKQEQELHKILEPWRIQREWYRAEGPILSLIEMLPKPAPKPVRLHTAIGTHPLTIWRREHEVSMDELATRLGTSRVNVHRWETRKRMPRQAMCRKIATLTGVTATQFVEELCGVAA